MLESGLEKVRFFVRKNLDKTRQMSKKITISEGCLKS